MLASSCRYSRLRSIGIAAIAAAAFLFTQGPGPAAADEPAVANPPVNVTAPVTVPTPVAVTAPVVVKVATTQSAATAVVKAAESHLGARYRLGSIGPRTFDCSGLVYSAFTEIGLKSRIGGLRSAHGLYSYFARRHLASRSAPKVGDLVIWGGGSHVGIYVGGGRAISALSSGVRIARVSAVLAGFTTYLHTRLANVRVAIAPPTRTPTRTKASTPARRVTNMAALRIAPGTTHRKLATLHRGYRLTVLGSRRLSNHEVWLHVRISGGKTGWVAAWLTHS